MPTHGTAMTAREADSGTEAPSSHANTTSRCEPSSFSLRARTSSRSAASGAAGISIPGTSAVARLKGLAVGHAPTQMPQDTQCPALTTASCSKAAPSDRGSSVIALKGQSATQRPQPLQLSRWTTATRLVGRPPIHGSSMSTSPLPSTPDHVTTPLQRLSAGYSGR